MQPVKLSMVSALRHWFFNLGSEYGVDPLIFGIIYVGAIPFFVTSVAWLVRNVQRGRSILLPAICASFCFLSAYIYLAVSGKNIPYWVWAFIGGIILVGVFFVVRQIKKKISGSRSKRYGWTF